MSNLPTATEVEYLTNQGFSTLADDIRNGRTDGKAEARRILDELGWTLTAPQKNVLNVCIDSASC